MWSQVVRSPGPTYGPRCLLKCPLALRYCGMRSLYCYGDGGLSPTFRVSGRYSPYFLGSGMWLRCGSFIYASANVRVLFWMLTLIRLANICSMATLTAQSAELTALVKDDPSKHKIWVEVMINLALIALTTITNCVGVQVSLSLLWNPLSILLTLFSSMASWRE